MGRREDLARLSSYFILLFQYFMRMLGEDVELMGPNGSTIF